tara:strand:+ start:23030 stop:24754 length:1725 start_codon:yes stop_codon:yes gene_type:complete
MADCLTDLEISNTYLGLIKTRDTCPLAAAGKIELSDGAGNTSSLSIGQVNQGATICGTAIVTGNITQSDSTCTSSLGIVNVNKEITVTEATCLKGSVDIDGILNTNNNNCLGGVSNCTEILGQLAVGGACGAQTKITSRPSETNQAGMMIQSSNISPFIRFNETANNKMFSVGLDAGDGSNFKISTGQSVNNSNNFVITAAGRVNINTTNGTDNLTVGGTGRFTSNLTSDGDISLMTGGLKACNGLGSAGYLLESTGSQIEWVAKGGGALCLGNVCGTGTGTKVPKWSDASTLIDSSISDDGSNVTTSNNLIVEGNTTVDGYVKFNTALRDGSNSSGTTGQILESTGTGIQWKTSTGTSCTGNIAGCGSVNILSKFTGPDSIGNSVIEESNSNIGIGRAPVASYKLAVNGSVNATGFTGNLTGNITSSTSVGGNMTATGQVGGASLSITGTASVGSLNSGSISSGSIAACGSITATSDIIAFSSSDERLKENLTCITNSNNIINNLTGYSFDWNNKSEREGPGIGVLAQDVQKVLPNAVCERENGYLAVDYIQLIPVMIEELKRLNKIVSKLES